MQYPLSVVIITLNASSHLEKCLQSCKFAAEVVIIDSGSQDNTIEIAKNYSAIVFNSDWLGFGKQKQFAVNSASHDWVLCLDADEWLSPDLINEIKTLFSKPLKYKVFCFPRCNKFMGKFLRHGEGYPDLSIRLFNRKYAQWSDDNVHERINTNEEIGLLKYDLMHESGENISIYLDKQNKYTSLQASNLFLNNKKTSLIKIIVSPLIRFLKFYIFRLGFLDGFPGFVHIIIGCMNTFLKYVKLRELYRSEYRK